jgi:uncharacterized protein YwqG
MLPYKINIHMTTLILPSRLEPFRNQFETTVKPYVEIKTQLVDRASLWQSKIAGFPYLPKGYDYPTTPEGENLFLLIQINFAEVPPLDGFPQQGILEIFIDKGGAYGVPAPSEPTDQSYFRILYFPEPDLNSDNLITNFDFLPTIWEFETDVDFLKAALPFYYIPSMYQPKREECFSLSFNLNSAPISIGDYQFKELIGSEAWDVLLDRSDEEIEFNEYYYPDVKHKLGGYPSFTQSDPREALASDDEPYILFLQIDSDSTSEDINIEWEDMGIANFFVKASDLQKLDFSNVIYNYDCC